MNEGALHPAAHKSPFPPQKNLSAAPSSVLLSPNHYHKGVGYGSTIQPPWVAIPSGGDRYHKGVPWAPIPTNPITFRRGPEALAAADHYNVWCQHVSVSTVFGITTSTTTPSLLTPLTATAQMPSVLSPPLISSSSP